MLTQDRAGARAGGGPAGAAGQAAGQRGQGGQRAAQQRAAALAICWQGQAAVKETCQSILRGNWYCVESKWYRW